MRRPSQALLAIACALAPLACATVRPFDATNPHLAPDEGVLAVLIRSQLPISALKIGGVVGVSELEPGEHLLLLAVSEGSHRWTELAVPALDGGDVRFKLVVQSPSGRRGSFRHGWPFRVVAGHINYPDEIVVRGSRQDNRVHLLLGRRNRAAAAIETLRSEHSGLLSRYPITYSGSHRDDFPGFIGLLLGDAGDPDDAAP